MVIKRTSYDFLYKILRAWLNGERLYSVDQMDMNFGELYHISEQQSLSAAVCAALEDIGLMSKCPTNSAALFRKAKVNSIRTTILMDAEREKLFAYMENNGIWYMPLKGIILREYYPKFATRQMVDNDILYDASRSEDIRFYMEREGFKAKIKPTAANDAFLKPPVCNFELHRSLFAQDPRLESRDALAAYYGDVKLRLLKDNDNHFGYHFNDEDCYVYLIAHAYSHYNSAGTGIRILLDLYLYRKNKPALNEKYIAEQFDELGMGEFARDCASLSEKLFCGESYPSSLTQDEAAMLSYMERSGTFGMLTNSVDNALIQIQGNREPISMITRIRYLFRRLFPPLRWYEKCMPFAYRHRWALPFCWLCYFFHGIFINGKKNLYILKALRPKRDY